jgi:hypothetical protein
VNRDSDIDVLAAVAVRARQDLQALTTLRPVPALPSRTRRHGGASGGGWRRLRHSPAVAGAAVAGVVVGILIGIGLVGHSTPAVPEPSRPLQPGDAVDGMVLTTAAPLDTGIFIYCDPYISQSGTYVRYCAVPRLRLMIGYGPLADSQEALEQLWRAQRWRLYLDGHEVDLAAFGTLPDGRDYDLYFHRDMWLRQWAVTVNPTPGLHTVRYVSETSPVGDEPGGTTDITWTLNVI